MTASPAEQPLFEGRATRLGTPQVLVGIFVLSCAVRIALVSKVQAPWTFPDELGYQQTAINIARHGRLALYDKSGFAYPPLYPIVLAPLFVLGLTARTAYEWIKIENAVLMSLSLFPIYGIARYVLPKRPALVVVALSAAAPLMYYTALGMSENLAYPLFLVAVWAALRATAAPTKGNDLMLVVAIVLTCAARAQFVVLLPAAVTGIVGFALIEERTRGLGIRRLAAKLVRDHLVLAAGCVALAFAVAVSALTGHGAFSLAGRYSNVPGEASPSASHLLRILAYHAAGLVLAVGVLPFIGAIVAAYVCVRSGCGRNRLVFAALATSLTVWLLLETALSAYAFERAGDTPRIHERYLFYLVPLFLVALVAVLRAPRARHGSPIPLLAGTGVAAVSMFAIPFHTIITSNIVADSFSLEVFAKGGSFVPVSHATLLAVSSVIELGLLFAVLRANATAILMVTLVIFVATSVLVGIRIDKKAALNGLFVSPGNSGWVDRLHPTSGVVLVAGPPGGGNPEPEQTAYYNSSIKRLYYTCRSTLSPDFGEQVISIAADGTVMADGLPLETSYAVVPASSGVEGQVLAYDRLGGEALVVVPGDVLRINPLDRGRWLC